MPRKKREVPESPETCSKRVERNARARQLRRMKKIREGKNVRPENFVSKAEQLRRKEADKELEEYRRLQRERGEEPAHIKEERERVAKELEEARKFGKFIPKIQTTNNLFSLKKTKAEIHKQKLREMDKYSRQLKVCEKKILQSKKKLEQDKIKIKKLSDQMDILKNPKTLDIIQMVKKVPISSREKKMFAELEEKGPTHVPSYPKGKSYKKISTQLTSSDLKLLNQGKMMCKPVKKVTSAKSKATVKKVVAITKVPAKKLTPAKIKVAVKKIQTKTKTIKADLAKEKKKLAAEKKEEKRLATQHKKEMQRLAKEEKKKEKELLRLSKIKPYCGIGPMPRTGKRGTLTECSKSKQIRYFGLKKVDKKTLENISGKSSDEKGRQNLILKITGLRGVIFRNKGRYETTKDETNKPEYYRLWQNAENDLKAALKKYKSHFA